MHTITAKFHTTLIIMMVFPFLCFFAVFARNAFLFLSVNGWESIYSVKVAVLYVCKEMRNESSKVISHFWITTKRL